MPTSALICACLFLTLHTIGGRYIYSYVPYEKWLAGLGFPSIDAALGLGRNSWDRLVHFSFGLLWVHPISSWLHRHRGLTIGLATYTASDITSSRDFLYSVAQVLHFLLRPFKSTFALPWRRPSRTASLVNTDVRIVVCTSLLADAPLS